MEAKQKLPASGPKREALREKGQFWTPQWVAEAMVQYTISGGSDHLFDPAVGTGAFFRAAKNVVAEQKKEAIQLFGTEIDRDVLDQALRSGLTEEDISAVEIRDFVLDPPQGGYSAIVANPPYIRHHRISQTTKQDLRLVAKRILGKTLDGRTGYHVYFLLSALEKLAPNGRLSFIMPSDTCEGIFARTLWKWILDTFRLDAVVTFAHDASPFPTVDTNAIVFMISAAAPSSRFAWCRCTQASTPQLREWVKSGFPIVQNAALSVVERDIEEAYETGLSRPPQTAHVGPVLGDFLHTTRGIATGCNEFFFMTKRQASARNLPLEWFVRAVGRTRDVQGDEITPEHLHSLDESGRPTYLLSLDGRDSEEFPKPIQAYLKRGDVMKVPQHALIKQRSHWYKMERRKVPPFLFAYLGRRSARFIRNTAGVVPLTGFLCVYSTARDDASIERLWRLLQHPDTIANLHLVAKSYGSGAIKVEPRALERVPVTARALHESGLSEPDTEQVALVFTVSHSA